MRNDGERVFGGEPSVAAAEPLLEPRPLDQPCRGDFDEAALTWKVRRGFVSDLCNVAQSIFSHLSIDEKRAGTPAIFVIPPLLLADYSDFNFASSIESSRPFESRLR